MLTLHFHRDAKGFADYHAKHLKDGGDLCGARAHWVRQGASFLGLTGPVTAKAFRRLCHNKNPKTGHRLTQRSAAHRRAALDLVFSPPKSVSTVALIHGAPRITAAHNVAVNAALIEAERVTSGRVRRAGADTDRVTGNIVGAVFLHFTSRENDPQLHSHCTLFNATYDPEEKVWKALQASEIYRLQKLLMDLGGSRVEQDCEL